MILCLRSLKCLYNRINDKYGIVEHMIECTVKKYNRIIDSKMIKYIKKTGDVTEAQKRYRNITISPWLMDPEDVAIKMIIEDI